MHAGRCCITLRPCNAFTSAACAWPRDRIKLELPPQVPSCICIMRAVGSLPHAKASCPVQHFLSPAPPLLGPRCAGLVPCGRARRWLPAGTATAPRQPTTCIAQASFSGGTLRVASGTALARRVAAGLGAPSHHRGPAVPPPPPQATTEQRPSNMALQRLGAFALAACLAQALAAPLVPQKTPARQCVAKSEKNTCMVWFDGCNTCKCRDGASSSRVPLRGAGWTY